MPEKSKSHSSIEDDIKKDTEDKPSDFSKVTELLLNQKWRRRKTVLHKRVIAKISALDVISQIYDIEFIKDFIVYYTEYLTSEGGKGRNDIVDIAKFQHIQEQERNNELLAVLRNR